jgi:uncharacterized protein involved in exopolysaccharide biosynthesis
MNQQPQPTSLYPVERGDELSLIELWKVLVEYKLLIIFFTVIATLGAIYYSLTRPTIYQVEVVMLPSQKSGSSAKGYRSLSGSIAGLSVNNSSAGDAGDKALARLMTHSFLINYIKKKNIKPNLFPERWNKAEKEWLTKEPSDYESTRLLLDMITISTNPKSRAGLVELSLKWVNPADTSFLVDVANDLVEEMNLYSKNRKQDEANKGIEFLEERLSQTSVLSTQQMLYKIIEQKTNIIVLTKIKDDFVFEVIDPAVTPRIYGIDSKLTMAFIGIILGIFFGSFVSVSINYFKKK